MNWGDVVLVRFPHPSGVRGKKRPAVVVQSDFYSGAIGTLVVAEVTTNLAMVNDPACLFVDLNTPDGKATGLLSDSVVSGLLLATIGVGGVSQVLGTLECCPQSGNRTCIRRMAAYKANPRLHSDEEELDETEVD